MTTKEKKYPVTEEIADLFLEAGAAKDCRNQAIDSIWGTRKAIKYGKICRSKEREAWELIWKLYPELGNKPLLYNYDSNELIIRGEKE